jgi:glycosyltransferase involved in cell wall biosynthesis
MQEKPKRILIFSLVYFPKFIGGAEVAVKEITDRIPNASFDMVTLRTEHERSIKVGNVTIYSVGPYCGGSGILQKILRTVVKHIYPFLALAKAIKLHREYGYTHTWSIMASYSGFAALFFKWRYPEIPFLLTLQEGDPIPYIKRRAFLVYPLFVKIFRKADTIQAISNYLAVFAKDMGYTRAPVVIPNGVAIEYFTKDISEEKIDALQTKLGKQSEDIFIMTASRLVKKNGVEDIITALTFLPEKYKLVVAGTGKLEKSLKSKVTSLKLENRVNFVGFISHELLPLYLKACDIFVRPSLSEGLGNSFLEAMAAGVPIIGTPVGGIPDFLVDRETGIFCDPENPESLASAVMLYEDIKLKQEIIINAKELVIKKFDWDAIAQKMSNLL